MTYSHNIRKKSYIIFFILVNSVISISFPSINITDMDDSIQKGENSNFLVQSSSSNAPNKYFFNYFKDITIKHDQVSGTGFHENFPLLISILFWLFRLEGINFSLFVHSELKTTFPDRVPSRCSELITSWEKLLQPSNSCLISTFEKYPLELIETLPVLFCRRFILPLRLPLKPFILNWSSVKLL